MYINSLALVLGIISSPLLFSKLQSALVLVEIPKLQSVRCIRIVPA